MKTILIGLIIFLNVSCKVDYSDSNISDSLDFGEDVANDILQLVSEYELLEHHRVWISENAYDKNDSLYSERKTFKSYDKKNRLINANDIKFYRYNELDKVEEEKLIYRGFQVIRIDTTKYIYDENQNLIHKIKLIEPVDTLETNEYTSNGQLTKSFKGDETTIFDYTEDKLTKETKARGRDEIKISNFRYDSLGRLVVKNQVFSGTARMKTTYTYDNKNRLITEIDSSATSTFAKDLVELKTEYKYNELDSIIEIKKLGRVINEKEFKLLRKVIIKYE